MSESLVLIPGRTYWHITFGTYGSRLHGADEPTVDRQHNQLHAPFLPADAQRHEKAARMMKADTVWLTQPQRAVIEALVPKICERGGWGYGMVAAPGEPDNDHVHVLLHADSTVHGKRIRMWLKRWLTEELNSRWPRGKDVWWAEAGSTLAVKDERYLRNVYEYIKRQRTLPAE
ncbi:MAG: hypothetical protein GC164_13955 [Phycisphaera sp.]|nr:hypothetical protein [Phycisphaera sp.]